MTCFARVSSPQSGDTESEGDLSTQEKDLLSRSTKKAKDIDIGECSSSLVKETPPSQLENFHVAAEKGTDRKTVSYKDVCLGVNGHNVSEEDKELFELDDKLSESEKEIIRIPWKRSLLVKLLGKRMNLRYFHARLIKLWRPTSPMEVIDIDNEYYVIRFEDLSDLQHVMDDGPWMLPDHYIVIQRWQPSFFPMEDDLRWVAVWVRIPGLPIEFYDWRVLRRIGNVLGRTVKIDANTLKEKSGAQGEFFTERAKFARVCIEVDLNKVLISKFSLEGRVYHVEYEGLNLVCFKCRRYGHKSEACPLNVAQDNPTKMPAAERVVCPEPNIPLLEHNSRRGVEDQVDGSTFEPWMIVQKNQLRNGRNSSGFGGKGNVSGESGGIPGKVGLKSVVAKRAATGSRFNVLDMEGSNAADLNKNDMDVIKTSAAPPHQEETVLPKAVKDFSKVVQGKKSLLETNHLGNESITKNKDGNVHLAAIKDDGVKTSNEGVQEGKGALGPVLECVKQAARKAGTLPSLSLPQWRESLANVEVVGPEAGPTGLGLTGDLFPPSRPPDPIPNIQLQINDLHHMDTLDECVGTTVLVPGSSPKEGLLLSTSV
ncbi:Zinc finger, CCHC-type [Sesbania bispinosa]|nr:Zinc finger, CCHC-type [Sesbania bispinosa]